MFAKVSEKNDKEKITCKREEKYYQIRKMVGCFRQSVNRMIATQMYVKLIGSF